MTPKEKAKKLIYRYHDDAISKMLIIQGNPFDFAKQCAIIAVDEILNETRILYDISWWSLVKSEIEKL